MPNLTVNGGAGNDKVYSIGAGITFAADANLDLDLTNDAGAGPGDEDEVELLQVSNTVISFFALSGTGMAKVKVSKSVFLGTRCGISTVNGDLTVEANWNTSTPGNFSGVSLSALAGLGVSGTGQLVVRGKGGDTGDNNYGVATLLTGPGIAGGTTGTALVEGTGGPSSGNTNHGVLVGSGTSIGSLGSDLNVTGMGGGTAASNGNNGIHIAISSLISAGGTGMLTIDGTGGSSTGGGNNGILIAGFIGSAGAITVTGAKGANGTAAVDINIPLGITNNGRTFGQESIIFQTGDGGLNPHYLVSTFINSSTTETSSFGPNSQLNLYVGGPGFTGATAGRHHPLRVEGLIDLNGVNLVTNGPYVPVVGDNIFAVVNDGTDPVQGKITYDGVLLDEGDPVPNFQGSSVPFYITYIGGDGNDVVISSDATTFIENLDLAGGNKNALAGKFDQARTEYCTGKPAKIAKAITKLEDVIIQADEFALNGKLTSDERNLLVALAQAMLTAIQNGTLMCPPPRLAADGDLISVVDDELVKIYPNPTSRYVTLDLPNWENEISVILIDQLGRTIRTQQFDSGGSSVELDLTEQVSPGVYFLSFVSGSERLTKRLVVTK